MDFNKFCRFPCFFVLFFQQDLVTRSRSHHDEKGIRHFKGNIETFVRIILYSGLSEIFCLQNLWGGFATHYFDINVQSFTSNMFNISILFCFLKFFCFQRRKLSMGSAFKQNSVIRSAAHWTGHRWRVSVSIKSGDNSRQLTWFPLLHFICWKRKLS